MVATTTCGHCGKRFSYDDGLFAPSPAQDGFLGRYLCSDCSRERNEQKRHQERQAVEERLRWEEQQRQAQDRALEERRLNAERRQAEEDRRDTELRHRELMAIEEARLREEEWQRDEAHQRSLDAKDARQRELRDQGTAAIASARDLLLAGLLDDALRSVLRAQELLGLNYEVAAVKLEVARASKKSSLVDSIVKTIEQVAMQSSIQTQQEYDELLKWTELIRCVDTARADRSKKHIDSVVAERTATREREQRQAALRAQREAAAAAAAATAAHDAAAHATREKAALQKAAEFKSEQQARQTYFAIVGLVVGAIVLWLYLTQGERPSVASTNLAPPAAQPYARSEPGPESRTAATMHSPSQTTGSPEQIPNVQRGDTWTFAISNQVDPKRTYSLRRTVTETSDTEIVIEALNLSNSKAKVRRLTFDRAWGAKFVEEADGSRKDYYPPIQYFNFPLEIGKTWNAESQELGTGKTFRISAVVAGRERVHTEAGDFDALKVVLKTQYYEGTDLLSEAEDTSWYAPAAKRSIRSDEIARDLRTGKTTARSLMLLEYHVSN